MTVLTKTIVKLRKFLPTMQCRVGPYFLSYIVFMFSTISFLTKCFSNATMIMLKASFSTSYSIFALFMMTFFMGLDPVDDFLSSANDASGALPLLVNSSLILQWIYIYIYIPLFWTMNKNLNILILLKTKNSRFS